MSIKKSIGWCDMTWNPIKGLCPIGCKLPDGREYCYARRMYQRFKWDSELALQYSTIDIYKKDWPKKSSKIFVCSTIEMFHPEIPKDWRDEIFETIKEFPQHTFQILTKFPENIDRKMPDNVWLGVTVTKNEEEWKIEELCNKIEHFQNWNPTIFVSAEPMLDNCKDTVHYFDEIEWLIIGRLTGHGYKHDPKKEWIETLKDNAFLSGVSVFLKDNLKEIWGENLIQEFPK
ncbi:MAG: DUF5131 family protein [Candidatus Aminicenantes bacterium]|nr:DUF5131 family protein [Candidatus Aminicenantes bacterium]